jgi:hypothetical protein
MVLQRENVCQKKITHKNYFISIFPSMIVAYAVNFSQLFGICRQIESVGIPIGKSPMD